MKNKDFREIQVSSSLLVVIFLGVLALGVFIFLLGVSVGKKQAGISGPTQIVTDQIPEPVKEPPVKPTASESSSEPAAITQAAGGDPRQAAEPPAPKPSVREAAVDKAPASKSPAETKRVPAVSSSGLYYVQVAAFTERSQALAAAGKFKKQGYAAVVSNPKPSDTRTWYRVRLGGYASRERAADLLTKLNTAAGKKTDYQIVRD